MQSLISSALLRYSVRLLYTYPTFTSLAKTAQYNIQWNMSVCLSVWLCAG